MLPTRIATRHGSATRTRPVVCGWELAGSPLPELVKSPVISGYFIGVGDLPASLGSTLSSVSVLVGGAGGRGWGLVGSGLERLSSAGGDRDGRDQDAAFRARSFGFPVLSQYGFQNRFRSPVV